MPSAKTTSLGIKAAKPTNAVLKLSLVSVLEVSKTPRRCKTALNNNVVLHKLLIQTFSSSNHNRTGLR